MTIHLKLMDIYIKRHLKCYSYVFGTSIHLTRNVHALMWCEMGEWSEWSSECGDASRSRPITALLKTVHKYSCDGLRQNCEKDEEKETRSTLCKSHNILFFNLFFC